MDPFRERAGQIEQKAIECIELNERIFLLEREMQELTDMHFLAVAGELEQAGRYSDKLCEVRARSRARLEPEYRRLQGELDEARKQSALLDAELQKLKTLFNLDELDSRDRRPLPRRSHLN